MHKNLPPAGAGGCCCGGACQAPVMSAERGRLFVTPESTGSGVVIQPVELLWTSGTFQTSPRIKRKPVTRLKVPKLRQNILWHRYLAAMSLWWMFEQHSGVKSPQYMSLKGNSYLFRVQGDLSKCSPSVPFD